MTPAFGIRPQTQEGISVIGEAIRRVSPETAEFVIEIITNAPSAAQALRDSQMKITQLVQTLSPMGVHQADVQTIGQNVFSLYSPLGQGALPAYGAMPQIAQGAYSGQGGYGSQSAYGMYSAAAALQPEIQLGSYYAKHTARVKVREQARVGEVVDAVTRAGATIVGGFSFHVADESNARKAALDAAGRDARMKAEALAVSAGRQLGDAISISEELVACNGAYTALRTAVPLAFGPGSPQVAGELEYYARVSATFRFTEPLA